MLNQSKVKTTKGQADLGLTADVGQTADQHVGIAVVAQVGTHSGVAQEGARGVVLTNHEAADAKIPDAAEHTQVHFLFVRAIASRVVGFAQTELDETGEVVGSHHFGAKTALTVNVQGRPRVIV